MTMQRCRQPPLFRWAGSDAPPGFCPRAEAGPLEHREATLLQKATRRTGWAVFRTAVLTWAGMGVCMAQGGLEAPVRYSARDSIRYDAAMQTVYLYGAATVSYQDISLTAERIVYHFRNEEAQAFGVPDSTGQVQGLPQFTQADHTFQADSIRYSFRTGKGLIREVRTQEQETWVQARVSKRLDNGQVHSTGGLLTTCDRPRPHYHFRVNRMIVIPEDKIVAGPGVMKVGNVPVPLAVPFALFPNRPRGSAGILIPVWGESRELGFYLLNGGYYLPLGDHMDLQLTADIYSKGSWGARAMSRYRTRYRYNGTLDLTGNMLRRGTPELADFTRQRTFFVRWNHQLAPQASSRDRFNASVNAGSSNTFTNNFNSSVNDYLSNTFQSNIAWSRLWPGRPYNLTVNLRHSQNSLTRRFDFTLPSATFNLNRVTPFKRSSAKAIGGPRWYEQIGVSYSANFDNRVSTTEDQLFLGNFGNLLKESQNGVRQQAIAITSFKTRLVTVNPEFRVTDRWYFESLRKTYDPVADSVITDTVPGFARAGDWSASAALTSKVYFLYTYGNGLVKAVRHVITPSATFGYRPDFSTLQEGPFGPGGTTSSYSPFQNGIFGQPPVGASALVNLNLLQSVEAKVRSGKPDDDGRSTYKNMSLLDYVGLNASHDWLQDSTRWSQIGLAARTTLLNRIPINFVSSWDPYAADSLGRRINTSALERDGRLARLTYMNAAIGFDVKSKRHGQASGTTADNDRTVVAEPDPNRGARMNFNMPWQLAVNYSYDLSRLWSNAEYTESTRQSVLFHGDVTVLKYWKLGFNSGYDLEAGEWTPTSLNLYWDLHCWEFNLNVIPIGIRRSFSFRINIKASILRDMKVEQRGAIGNDGRLLF
ncbi:MAG: LPS-assembly protein LptD [Flavobacteriales bacterium]|nr:LPS-assembly protein LptD [Flavobacteriales bacterium]